MNKFTCNFVDFWKDSEWRETSTGGGCKALIKDIDKNHYGLVTDEEGVRCPTKEDKTVIYGIYDSESGECVQYFYLNKEEN